jgi:hypothetical protein
MPRYRLLRSPVGSEFRRLEGDRTGAALIAALRESPYHDIDLEPRRERLPVRDVKL